MINYNKKYISNISLFVISISIARTLCGTTFAETVVCAPSGCQLSASLKIARRRFKNDINNGGKVWDRSGHWFSENRRGSLSVCYILYSPFRVI